MSVAPRIISKYMATSSSASVSSRLLLSSMSSGSHEPLFLSTWQVGGQVSTTPPTVREPPNVSLKCALHKSFRILMMLSRVTSFSFIFTFELHKPLSQWHSWFQQISPCQTWSDHAWQTAPLRSMSSTWKRAGCSKKALYITPLLATHFLCEWRYAHCTSSLQASNAFIEHRSCRRMFATNGWSLCFSPTNFAMSFSSSMPQAFSS
mmetsp:Transcript_57405/g.134621  ORF Transcript_57405/g.134621 Transcript_57405/m.134621 type:complete len:206 (+) Transcript_57405:788-1405(+)